jgi:predicted unusual protein kinase regulating ubiquinone biosynthesis (AarF/ABC1/UbiB family)
MSKVSSSRLARFGKLGWLARRAVPIAFDRLREAADASPPRRAEMAQELLEKHGGIAEEALATLGQMKGLALKVGQMLSFMDGVLPEAYRPVYQRALAALQAQAPSLPWEVIQPVVEESLGRPVREVFEHLEEAPFAAASIGQVHRGVLRGGQQVAVKVQYPGVDRAMAADFDNAELLHSMLLPFLGLAGGLKNRAYVKAVMAEVRARVLEELDYPREARWQARFAAMFEGDPEIKVPRVFPEASGARVLTSELCEGRSLQQIAELEAQAARDRYGRILTRFVMESTYQHGLFNADPHPGNYLFPADGRVVFLDFGCVKELPPWMLEGMKAYVQAALRANRSGAEADWDGFDQAIVRALKLDPGQPVVYRIYREFLLYILRPYLTQGPFEFTAEYSGESVDRVLESARQAVFAQGRWPRIPVLPPIPVDYTLLNRLQFGFYSVLTRIRARVDFAALFHQQVPGGAEEPPVLAGSAG